MTPANSQPRILIVDDEPAIAGVLVAYFHDESFVVEHAREGAIGLERALSGPSI